MFRKQIRKVLSLLLSLSLLLAGCSQIPQASSSHSDGGISTRAGGNSNTIVDLGAAHTTVPVAINTGFIGLSFEISQVCEIISLDEQRTTYYEQLYRNLGNGILHIGGHSADFSVWAPGQAMSCSTSRTVVNQQMISTFFAFVSRIHWKVVWQLNLINNDPQAAANEASYIASVAGSNLLAFSIGNEPDIYAKHNYRPGNWGYSDFKTEWETYRNAVLKRVPTASFMGPDACCETSFFYNFTSDEAQNIIATTHHYYENVLYTEPLTIQFALSKLAMDDLASRVKQWMNAAQQAGVPFEISESNTFSGAGKAGVSDTFIAALWATDYLSETSSLGVKGVEFHNSRSAAYSVFDSNGDPRPLYYGLLFFHALSQAPGSTIIQANVQTALNVSSYRVTDTDGTVHVLLINKDLNSNATVAILLDKSYSRAQTLALTAPSVNAVQNIALGGKTVSSQGTWSAQMKPLSFKGGIAYITVPKSSALEVTLS